MIRTLINIAVFLAGLGAVFWIGAGYVGSNPLGLAITALVGIIYLAGALELYRYQRATATLDHALAATTEPPADLAAWLAPLHPSLRNATRLRIAGERVALPGPALTPYLVGLLVLLGMLGTFLGMVATLRGTGIALESATDLQAIRASLAAPVKGLGFAFGTSVAGVAASAMLGLLSALCRRERIQAGQALDARIASTLRPHSLAHQREASFQLLQRQAEGMPALVDRLQAMLAAMAQHSQAVNDGLAQQSRQLTDALTRQSQTLADTLTRQSDTLAERLDRQSQTLASSLDEQSRRLGASLGEHSQTLAASLTRQSDTLSDTVARQSSTLAQTLTQQGESLAATLTQQGAALSDGLARQGDTLAATLTGQNASLATALTQQGESLASTLAGETRELAARLDQQGRTVADALGQHSQAMAERLAAGQDAFHEKAAQAYTGLAASVRQTLNDSVAASAQAAGAAIQPAVQATLAGLASETAAWRETIGQAVQQQLAELSGHFEASTAGVAGIWNDALARHQQASESLAESLRSAQQQLAAHFEQRSAALLDTVAARLQGATDEVRDGWRDAVTRQEQAAAALASQQGQTVAEAAGAFARHTAELLHAVEQSQTQLQAELAARDAQRESAWTHALEAMAAQLRSAWQETGAQTAEQQREICATLAQTAQDISSQSREHATRTVAEIGQLLEAAAQAPRAAADVVAELRQKLVDSMERDNAMLEERSRLLATVETLLGAVNHASSEQREAIDALVASSADLLERVGARFADSIESGAGRLEAASAQATASAADVASLGEAFGAAAQVFGAANDRLAEQLGRIETALDKSLARSDEQLAYYVAQAREVVDLSVLSQKQILEDLQRLAQQPEPAGAEAAETP
ncbi:DUF802 domain-containing protein [Bordetella bronchiseptica]|uniref:DUF802 domain-containing protein n=1 Tax=Bordetella bronchiseptica TaxID=518 RepID=UPI000461962A|nr:DUF802 domain-containing protein [Bordetella bronchiseptica]AWP83607.1 hypothetical protein B7P00_05610 [Bordetella bronchiseptica]AWQ09174.1 hypothetical protein B9G72_05605 [Bordetella bronchiseptica]AXT90449.1 DUF802 domain-containing protein [Bordetella bronchiseptica]KDB76333.1 PF05650 domain protein [Bordetella bronchiseptica CARE970018BB]KDD23505.1 PF05650 domain protein [Bordetella bronchiseptica MBORD785]